MRLLRELRTLKAILTYPLWALNKKGPDNHIYKMNRIRLLGSKYNCTTFIETGTFYGQTVNYATKYFKKVMSVEIYKPLFDYNVKSFAANPKVNLFAGNSVSKLQEMLGTSEGRCLFWLDGHYSGSGTGLGDKISPIIEELMIIKENGKDDHIILIDDFRLFGTEGYPTITETEQYLYSINPKYSITIDSDCLVSTPPTV